MPTSTTLSTEADAALQDLIGRLQTGLDTADPDLYDSMFAEDVLWGSPYGEVLSGFAPLNAVHRSMMRVPAAGQSRYELVQAVESVPGVIVAHVRRQALTDSDEMPTFSEMALYVLVKRDGTWVLAAGQNTPVRAKP